MPLLAILANYWQYALIGVLVLLLGIQTKRVDWCQEGRAEDKVIAEGKIRALGETIDLQNRAVEALRVEGEARKNKAETALKTAQNASRSAQAEAARLRGLPVPQASVCPAADAVAEIRRGLR